MIGDFTVQPSDGFRDSVVKARHVSKRIKPSRKWQKLKCDGRAPDHDENKYPGTTDGMIESWSNDLYEVNVRRYSDGWALDPTMRWIYIGIASVDGAARHDWRDMQRIKNELVGPEHEAVELYPAESRLVDTSNQFHLWVLKEPQPACGFPFGWHTRLVADASSATEAGARQREFDERPADCLDAAGMEALARQAGVKL